MTVVLAVGERSLLDALSSPDWTVEGFEALSPALSWSGEADVLVASAAAVERPLVELPSAAALPVVVVGDGSGAAGVLEAGAADYVLADAPPAVLVDRVAAAVERTRRERTLDAAFERAPRPMGVFDLDGRVVRRNETARTFDPDGESAGDRFWERPWVERSPVDSEAVRSGFEAAAAGRPQRFAGEVRDSEGRVRSMVVELRPLRADDGTVTGVFAEAVPVDDDELPGSDAAVTSVSRQLRTVVDNLPIVVFALDADGRFTLSEGQGLTKLGVAPGELVGRDVFEVYADNETVVDACRRALDGEEVNAVVAVNDRAFETWYQPVTDDDGAVVRVIGAAIDVTDLKERERELEQYETVIEAVPDGVFVLDEYGTIVVGNDTGTEMFGYEYDDLVGETFYRLIEDGVVDASVVEQYQDVVRELLSSGTDTEQARFEFPIDHPSGERRIIESHVTLRPREDGSFRGTIGVNRDVTERKRTERELRRQNERLEQLASVVSHDLRNPLNVAQGLTELLAEDRDDPELDDLRDSLDRMEELIAELLQLARTGQSVTDPELTSIASLAEDAWSTVSAPDADLETPADYEAPVDRSRARQLFENLFRNSVEHGGTAVTVRVGDLPDGPGFYVADDGTGIPEHRRDDVFEYGFSTSQEGTGLGLAIVREIAEAHGWAVELTESEAGGARFEFREALEAD